MPACTVLIAAPDLLEALSKRLDAASGEVVTFPHTDAVRALEAIVARQPGVIALERLFAATPRGAALINRIKADPSLSGSEIRVMSHDSDYARVSRPAAAPPVQVPPVLRAPTPQPAVPAPAPAQVVALSAPEPAGPVASAPDRLDVRGTRRTRRIPIQGTVNVLLDGNEARLVDLSTLGAQVVSATVLKPNQRVRLAFTEDGGPLRVNAVVAWALFEIPGGKARYRAGLEFADADARALEAFCARHGQP